MSTNSELSERLTSRANEVLTSLLAELQDEVMEAAARRSIGSEISARDVIEAFEERTRDHAILTITAIRRRRRLMVLLISYAAIALLLAIAAIALSSSNRWGEAFTPILALMSVSIVIASIGLLLWTRRRESGSERRSREAARAQDGFGAFMSQWMKIESLLRLVVANDLGTSAAELPLGQVLDAGLRSGSIDSQSHESLRELLRTRNDAVHGRTLDPQNFASATKVAVRLVRRLEEQLLQKEGGHT